MYKQLFKNIKGRSGKRYYAKKFLGGKVLCYNKKSG